MKRICILVAAALVAPVAALAQGGGAATAEAKRAAEVEQVPVTGQRGGGGRARVVAGAVETKTTTGRPYSAESISETLQVLADGNRINRRTVTRVYRDGEGRTRRETTGEDGSVKSIAISDPVAHANYTLDPEAKVAFKAGGNIVYPLGTPPSGGTYTLSISGGSGATAAARVAEEVQAAAAGRGGRGGGGGAVMMRSPARENPNVRKEDLGPQNVEGVMASGSRVTTLIPAGEIGNAQEIRIVSEQWFSDELQVLVMTKHSDPRTGETTYRLRNILRAEPDPSLFAVPADYTIRERGVRQPQ